MVNVQVVDYPFSNEHNVHTAVLQPMYQPEPCGEVKLVLAWSLSWVAATRLRRLRHQSPQCSLGMEAFGFGSVLPKLSVGA